MRMLILSSKNALHRQIGQISNVERSLREYAGNKKDYSIKFVYYDRANEFKVKPVAKKAQSIRRFIMGIEEKWGEIAFLLLLGGDEVVPFFRLQNPCADGDDSVLSDNPYASRDDDFFIPERVCARIPDNKDANFIIKQLQKSCRVKQGAFGYTARVWQKASADVYRLIGQTKDLKSSPPLNSETFKPSWLQDKDFLYFNLHGSKISANWYGQDQAEYPVALNPENIHGATGLVASEACYGAYIIGKSHQSALSLKFLSEDDIYCFCGSTTIAYGPAAPPSSEADLLVRYFFEYIKRGFTTGEGLRNAKIDFARKSLRRHGFLDDDDRKTLLQFVLYGDPTLRLVSLEKRRKG
jgi:hypothetical protein